MKEVGREWQQLDDEGRHRFQVKADADKYRFRKEKNNFESKMKKLQSNPGAALQEFEKEAIDTNGRDTTNLLSGRKRERVEERRGRKKKDPNMPKRSLSTFIYFSQDVSYIPNSQIRDQV